MKKKKQPSFRGMDEGLLEEFESELADEERSRKARVTVVMIGLVVGVLVGLYMTFSGGNFGGNKPISDTEVVVDIGEDESEIKPQLKPQLKPVITEVVEVVNSQEQEAMEPSKTAEPEGENFSAPDILITDKPMEAASETDEADFTFEPLPEDEDFDNPLRDIHKDVDTKKGESNGTEKKTASITIGGKKSESAIKPVVKPAKKVIVKPTTFAVRISATTDAVEALGVRDKLKKKGYEAWISQGKVRQKIFRVVAGEFNSIREASALSAQLAKAGFRPRTSYIQKGSKVTLKVGVYQTRQQAAHAVGLMKKKGFDASIRSSGGALDLYVVLVGKYNSFDRAKLVEKKISDSGQKTMGVAKAN